jgi:hypothetical protein
MRFWPWRQSPYVRAHPVDHEPCSVACRDGIWLLVEIRRREIFRSVEGEFPITSKRARDLCQARNVAPQPRGQAPLLCEQYVCYVVNPWWLDAVRTKQTLQRKLHDLLRLAHDVGPALCIEKRVHGRETRSGPTHVVGSEIAVLHYAATVQ